MSYANMLGKNMRYLLIYDNGDAKQKDTLEDSDIEAIDDGLIGIFYYDAAEAMYYSLDVYGVAGEVEE